MVCVETVVQRGFCKNVSASMGEKKNSLPNKSLFKGQDLSGK